MKATQKTMFQCPTCGELHEWDDEAEDCCPPNVARLTVYECGNCGTTYGDQDLARRCCWDGETELEPYVPTHGQQRLPLFVVWPFLEKRERA